MATSMLPRFGVTYDLSGSVDDASLESAMTQLRDTLRRFVTTTHHRRTARTNRVVVFVNPTAAPGHFPSVVTATLNNVLKSTLPGVGARRKSGEGDDN